MPNGKPDWTIGIEMCPCGKKAGPHFKYGLCDECCNKTPQAALLRMGWWISRGYQIGKESK